MRDCNLVQKLRNGSDMEKQKRITHRQWLHILLCIILLGIIGERLIAHYHLFTFVDKDEVLRRLDTNIKSANEFEKELENIYETPPKDIAEWLEHFAAYNARHDRFHGLIMSENYLTFWWNSISGSRERMQVSLSKEWEALSDSLTEINDSRKSD